jgi:catechol 2,3-dioxygenase-like lactoylglutathione lyase family enzyme
MPEFTRALHVGLTVRDMHQSADWYMRVLGFRFVKEFKGPPEEQGSPRILLLHPQSGFLVGLVNHPHRSADAFSPLRTGLDHLGLEVAHEVDLATWIAHFDALGVEHSPIRDLGHSAFVSLEDPDGIQFEMWFTRVSHMPSATPG